MWDCPEAVIGVEKYEAIQMPATNWQIPVVQMDQQPTDARRAISAFLGSGHSLLARSMTSRSHPHATNLPSMQVGKMNAGNVSSIYTDYDDRSFVWVGVSPNILL